MAWLFADGFDLYAAAGDAGTHWDIGSSYSLVATGRFSGSQSLGNTASPVVYLSKTVAANDATHHIVVSFLQIASLVGTVSGLILQLQDGAAAPTAQCTVIFKQNGDILLMSGNSGGTLIATYSAAFTQNVWVAFEIEITIHNTAGAIHIRKNGNTSDDFVATNLNTRAGTTNNYANTLRVGLASASAPFNASNQQRIDDLLWFSTAGAAPNTWVGDIRSCQLVPVSDASVQFSKAPNPVNVTPRISTNSTSKLANQGTMASFTASFTGTISSGIVQVATGGTGNMKAAIYDSSRSVPLAASNAVVNPVAGANAITFATPLAVTKGTVYYLAVDQDFTIIYSVNPGAGFSFTTTYASFPSSPSLTASQDAAAFTVTITSTISSEFVNDVTQDGLTSYVYDSTVGHADFYDLSDLPFVPVSIIGLQTRGYVEKSDAGLRQAQLQVKSGATTVQSAVLTLATSFQYTGRVDTTDPNTGSAWTAAAVNAVQVGPYVTA